jgi:hypothetical protein
LLSLEKTEKYMKRRGIELDFNKKIPINNDNDEI